MFLLFYIWAKQASVRHFCRRPNALQDQLRDNDYEGFRDRDYDLVALANNSDQGFSDEGNEEVMTSLQDIILDSKLIL